jgi:Na+/H+ antiporter NhaD/arsenite permease-like protein
MDAKIWPMVAYCVGTGGSLLIIGSAAGVVVMGMENIRFDVYLKKMTLPVLAGYFAGLLVLLLF